MIQTSASKLTILFLLFLSLQACKSIEHERLPDNSSTSCNNDIQITTPEFTHNAAYTNNDYEELPDPSTPSPVTKTT